MMAATLAIGPFSAVSHRAAAGLAGFDDIPPSARIDVIAPRGRGDGRAGIALHRLWESAGLPMPEVNSIVEGLEVDFCWPDRRLIVELDGPAFRRHPAQQERDRRHGVTLALAGYAVHRFGTNRIYSEPRVVLGEIKALYHARWQRFHPLSG